MSEKTETALFARPAAEKNAVERMSLIFEWAEPLDNDAMLTLSAMCDSLSAELPRKVLLRSSDTQPSDGVNDTSETSENAELAAIFMDDNEDIDGPPNVKKYEVIIGRERFGFSVHAAYPGWKETRKKAFEISNALLETIREFREINAVGFQVVNGFYLEKFDGNFKKILRNSCTHFPANIFSREGYWHVESGFFEDSEPQSDERLLTNLKMAYFPEDSTKKLSLSTLHRMDFSPEKAGTLNISDLWTRYDILHPMNKSLVHSILHDDICLSIGLEVTGDCL